LLRAKGNTLCRACHVAGQNGVVLGEKTVLMPWNRKISLADYQSAPKLGLDANGETGHPVLGHPMTGVNTLASDKGALTCSTCHQAHTSKSESLMPDTATNSIQLCEQCHNKV
jgi:predicted CXXCH cytochrome family protein